MVRSLFERSLSAVRTAVMDGLVSDVGDLPLHLRHSLFEYFRLRQSVEQADLDYLLRCPGFFDGFTAINLHDEIGCSNCPMRRFSDRFARSKCCLASFVEMIGANRSLAENVVDLTLGVTGHGETNCRRRHPPLRADVIGRLLGFCGNLKRLRLIADTTAPTSVASLSELRSFSETNNVKFPQLEHLSLLGCRSLLNDRKFPKRLFESLRSLELYAIRCEEDVYRDVLACCQNTLISLNVSDYDDWRTATVSPVPVRLPNLSSLTFETLSSTVRMNAADIAAHCPNLTTATLTLVVDILYETELTNLAKLSERLTLYLRLVCGWYSYRITDVVRKFGENLVGLCVVNAAFMSAHFGSILLNCPNLTCLKISHATAQSVADLENFFNNKQRARQLTDLHLHSNFSSTMLESLFANCFGLKCLKFRTDNYLLEIDNYLRTWIRNGARPVSIFIEGLRDLYPETVYSLMKASGVDLKSVTLTVRVTDANLVRMCLNVVRNCCPFMDYCSIKWRDPCYPIGLTQVLCVRRAVEYVHPSVLNATRIG